MNFWPHKSHSNLFSLVWTGRCCFRWEWLWNSLLQKEHTVSKDSPRDVTWIEKQILRNGFIFLSSSQWIITRSLYRSSHVSFCYWTHWSRGYKIYTDKASLRCVSTCVWSCYSSSLKLSDTAYTSTFLHHSHQTPPPPRRKGDFTDRVICISNIHKKALLQDLSCLALLLLVLKDIWHPFLQP